MYNREFFCLPTHNNWSASPFVLLDSDAHAFQLYDAPDPQHSGAAVAPSAVDARSSTSSQSDATSLAPLPAKLLPSSKPVPVQTNVASHPDPQAYSLSPPSHDVPSDGPEKRAVLPDTGKPGLTFADSDSESFHFLEQDSGDTESTLSARDDDVAQSPHVSRQQQAMLSNIQKAQVGCFCSNTVTCCQS